MTRVEVAIIGAGPAGLAVAETLAGRGVEVLLLDENPWTGGQLLRRAVVGRPDDTAQLFDGSRRRGLRLMRQAARAGVRIQTGVQVLGIFPENRLLMQHADGRVVEMAARCIVCATGARERFLPFPGWTLPGVIATGAAQILLKQAGVLPGGRIVVGGTGPLPPLLSRQIVAHGGKVVAWLDGTAGGAMLHLLRSLPWQAAKLADGIWLLGWLAACGVPMRFNHWIVGAVGKERLAAVQAARLDRQGRIVPGSKKTYTADCLAVGYGFVPNTELLVQAGCDVIHRIDQGGWVVRTTADLETSRPNLFAAGEVTGIGGGAKAMIDGRLAGLAVLERLGKGSAPDDLRRRLLRRRARELAFGRLINRLSRGPADWADTVDDATVVCRCEDVRMADVRRRLREGFTSPGALKKATRCGMGNCQGRLCGTITAEILGARIGGDNDGRRAPSTRSPVKPVALGALAQMQRLADTGGGPNHDR